MSNKQQKQNVPRGGLVSVLYRLDDAPLITVDTADMTKITEALSFHQYYCPFNTSLPLCEFDKTDEIIKHLDSKVGADLGQEDVLVSPPRRIQAQDILLTTYQNPARRTCFFLIPKLSREDFSKAAQSAQRATGVGLFPRVIARRFHALTLDGAIDGYDIIPDLLDTSYRPDN